MTNSIPNVLAHSAEEVLETMFFTQVVGRRPLHEEATQEKPFLAVRLCFLGGGDSSAQPGGHLDIEVSREGAQWIASSFLAADDGSVPQHRVADVICELTNVVCGNVMSNIASESGFSMLSPEVIRGSTIEWPHAVRYEESFQLERGWLTLRLGLASAS
jgi:CheY-specific phosphatase CheX